MDLKCSIKGCGGVVFAVTMCQAHYARKRRGADLHAPLSRRTRYLNKNGTRICNNCSEVKSIEEFQDNPKGLAGKLGTCRVCNAVKSKLYRERNKERLREGKRQYASRRRAMLKNAPEIDPSVNLKTLREKGGDLCTYCGVLMDFETIEYAPHKASVDHIVPLSRGGAHTFGNTTLACLKCNMSKFNKTLQEWEGPR